MDMSGEAVGAVMFIGMTIVFSLLVWFFYKGKRDKQLTIRAAIDKGQELSPELLESLNPAPAPNRDLRRGIMSIGIAAGLALFGYIFPEEELNNIFAAIAMLPLLMGIAWILLHRFANRG